MTSSEPFSSGWPLAAFATDGALPAAFAPLSATQFKTSPDSWAIDYWLTAAASKSENTRRSYRKEITRWQAFVMALRGDVAGNDHLVTATYDDAARFIAWIEQEAAWPIPPEVAARLGMSLRQCEKPKASPVVLRQAVVILHGFYEEMARVVVPGSVPPTSCCTVNPFKPFRRRFERLRHGVRGAASPDAVGVAKALSDQAWSAVWEAACESAPNSNAGQKKTAARRRLIIAMLRATWERRHAVAGIVWQDIQRSRGGVWHVRRDRKGQGAVWAPVPSQLVDEIALFRVSLGRPASADADEGPRSIFWMGGHSAGCDGPLSDETIYREVKNVFEDAAKRLDAMGNSIEAAELRRPGAGPHTIRHTMATQFLAAGGQVRHAQEALGHSSMVVTTSTYDTRQDGEQAAELERQWATSNSPLLKR